MEVRPSRGKSEKTCNPSKARSGSPQLLKSAPWCGPVWSCPVLSAVEAQLLFSHVAVLKRLEPKPYFPSTSDRLPPGKAEIRCVVYLFLYVNIVFPWGSFMEKSGKNFPHPHNEGVYTFSRARVCACTAVLFWSYLWKCTVLLSLAESPRGICDDRGSSGIRGPKATG